MLYNNLPYIDTPKYCYALNPKVGCTTTLYHLYKKYHDSDHEEPLTAPQYINKMGHTMVPFKPVVLLVRNPIDRFLSAMCQLNLTDVDSSIDSLLNNTKMDSINQPLRYDAHFRHQHERAFGITHLFRFPEHIHLALEFMGVEDQASHLNVSKSLKPYLGIVHIKKLKQFYLHDFALYDIISTPNTIIDTKMASTHLGQMHQGS